MIYTVAFAIGCMSLALAIVYRIQKKHTWTKYLIICHSSLLGCMMVSSLILLSSVFLSGPVHYFVEAALKFINLSAVTFLIVFIPYFTTWIIASPWRNPYKALFFTLASVYFVLGILSFFLGLPYLTKIVLLIFVFVLCFCFAVMIKNLSSIKDKRVRKVSICIIICSVAMLPFVGIGLFYPKVLRMIYGLYFFSWSLILMIFFFIFFGSNSDINEKKVLSLDDLAKYHITKREFSVIELISKGLTNKEISSQLNISVNTVNNHVANIFTKTEVRSRIDLLNLIRELW